METHKILFQCLYAGHLNFDPESGQLHVWIDISIIMFVCRNCTSALRRAILPKSIAKQRLHLSSKATTAQKILSQPTWSVRSLLSNDEAPENISPKQLHHLLRLSALPLPKSKEEDDSMIATLQSQLQFVRAVQRVDTKGVEPLQAVRDETEKAVKESTIGLDSLKDFLQKEEHAGHYKRPRRVKTEPSPETIEAEDWDALSTASRKAGKYFVVESAKKDQE